MYRDTLGTSLDMSVDALRTMGMRGAQAVRVVKVFRERDREGMAELAKVYDGDRKVFISTARRHIQNFANLFKADAARARGRTASTAPGKGRRARNPRTNKNRQRNLKYATQDSPLIADLTGAGFTQVPAARGRIGSFDIRGFQSGNFKWQ